MQAPQCRRPPSAPPRLKTWVMNKAMTELIERHGVTLAAPVQVPLAEPTASPMLLSGLASTLDTDCERVQFAPFAFELSADIPLHFDHQGVVAGRIERLEHNDRGELTIQAYVDHETARRCNAFSVSGDVEDFTLHDRQAFVLRAGREDQASPDQPGACAGRPQRQGSAARAAVTDVRVWRRHPTSQSLLKA